MPFDLSGIEGLTEDQIKAINGLHDEDVNGLKVKNETLIAEQRAAKEKADAAAKAEEEAKRQAELLEARKAGDLEALEKTLKQQQQERENSYKAELEKRDSMILGSKRDAVIADIASQFSAPDAAKLFLSNMVEVAYGDNGTVTTFKGFDGFMTTDPKSFTDWARQNEQLSTMMKPIDSSGGGASGGKPQGGALGAKPAAGASEAEKTAYQERRLKEAGY